MRIVIPCLARRLTLSGTKATLFSSATVSLSTLMVSIIAFIDKYQGAKLQYNFGKQLSID
jgi:hypothetical protein